MRRSNSSSHRLRRGCLTNVNQLSESERHFSLTFEELSALNPNTHTAPTFRNQREARIVGNIYDRVRAWCLHVLEKDWPGVPKTPFNMSNDSGMFRTKKDLHARDARFSNFRIASLGDDRFLPFYESKLVHQFNHRYATFEECDEQSVADGQPQNARDERLRDCSYGIEPRYWLDAGVQASRFPGDWFLVYRMIASATNERTSIAAVIPGYPCGHTLSVITDLSAVTAALLSANLNSIVFDFVTRVKVPGASFGHWIWKQLPALHLDQYVSTPIAWHDQAGSELWFLSRCLELTFTAWDLRPFARDCGYNGPPFRWDEDRRFLLRSELDAALFHIYGIARQDADYIMDAFPIVRRKDEATYGDYRSKRVILEMYDEMAEAIRTGQPYRTHLDPPPADSRVAHPARAGGAIDSGGLSRIATVPRGLPSSSYSARVAETGPTYQATVQPTMPAPPRFGAIQASAPTAKPAPAPRAEPEPAAGQPDLFGVPAASPKPVPARAVPKSEPVAPPLVVPVMPAPQGAYPARLAQVMALRKQSTPEAIGTLVAALGDPDANIRWLAALTLKGIGGRARKRPPRGHRRSPSEVAREEAVKLLDQLEAPLGE